MGTGSAGNAGGRGGEWVAQKSQPKGKGNPRIPENKKRRSMDVRCHTALQAITDQSGGAGGGA